MSQKPIETVNLMSRAEFEKELALHMDAIKENISVLGWGVIVAPLRPRTESPGGLALPQTTIDAQEYLTQLGKLIQIGPAYYESPGLKPYQRYAPKVGEYVTYKRYGGVGLTFYYRDFKLIHLRDDELLWTVSDVDNFRMYV